MLSNLFYDANAGIAFITALSYWREYRKFKTGAKIPNATVKSATNFITHCSLTMWWVLGIILVPVLDISPYWLVPWAVCGLIGVSIVDKVVAVSGLPIFLAAGEEIIDQLIAERSREMTTE